MLLDRVVRTAAATLTATLVALPAAALTTPDKSSALAKKEFRSPKLQITNALQKVGEQSSLAASALRRDLATLGVSEENAFLDGRSGRWGTLIPVEPLLPGTGDRNDLVWQDIGLAAPTSLAAWEAAAWQTFTRYLENHEAQLRIDVRELAQPGRVTVHDDGALIQIIAPREVGGVLVRDSYLSAVINHGNLILLGAYQWGDLETGLLPDLSDVQASEAVAALVKTAAAGTWGKSHLELVPVAGGTAPGGGYGYRLAWVLNQEYAGEAGHYEALVDAHSGEVLAFTDTNQYQSVRRAQGGVYPVSNDGVPPDGTEQPGTPMPFTDIANGANNYTTDTGGNVGVCLAGNITSTLAGPFVKINDNCGAVNETSAANLDLGSGAGTDCVVPGGHSAGDTHASRTGFYELNKLIEQARGQLPNNTWLAQQLTSNMNINNTCNAFWGGSSVNFYRSGGGCNNTGEIAGIFDHEWGHGIDDNDANGNVASPGEAIADAYMVLRLKNSCVGRNFFQSGFCGGYGDPCTPASLCSGVRDVDFAHHQSGLPHDLTWVLNTCPGGAGPCAREVHCEGYPYAETVWDLFNRDLPTIMGLSSDTALEVAVRLHYLGAGPVGTLYQCVQGSGGCPANSIYLNTLAVDDDNGNLTNGTPHMQAIASAFNRHGIGCPTPVVQTSGCPNSPTAAPVVSATPQDRGASLSWAAVPNAVKYRIYRTEGALGCNFGKALIGETYGTTFVDGGLQNGRSYFYAVAAVGLSNTCLGPLSACATVTPVAGANLGLDTASVGLTINTGDGDPYLDNCENATVTFNVNNTGGASQNNVRIDAVQPLSHPAMAITGTSAPTAALASCASTPQSFSFKAVDMVPDAPVQFRVDVTSDELFPAVRSQIVSLAGTEGDAQFFATRTYDFEADPEGWQLVTGTFNRTNVAPGGAGGAGTFYFQSSSNLDNQCDEIQSPVLSLTATSTLSLQNNFAIEPFSAGSWYDRANVGVLNTTTGTRSVVVPSSGRAYNASGPGGPCGLDGQQGWADTSATWAASNWTAGALGSAGLVGVPVRINVKYGTDPGLSLAGFRFDQVTLTDFNLKTPDTSGDTCVGGNAAPTATADSSIAAVLGPVAVPVLTNDSDPNGDCLRVTSVTAPTAGVAFINTVGCGTDTVQYVPNLSCGLPCNDSFQYTVSDGNGGTASAIVTITQTPVDLQGFTVE